MRECRINFRIDQDTKRKAVLMGIPCSQICRTAIESAIRTRQKRGQIDIEPISSRQEAAKIFNKIQPVILGLFKKHPDLLKDLDGAMDALELLKEYILEVPEKYFLDYAKFISGNGHAHAVFFEFLKDQEVQYDEA